MLTPLSRSTPYWLDLLAYRGPPPSSLRRGPRDSATRSRAGLRRGRSAVTPDQWKEFFQIASDTGGDG